MPETGDDDAMRSVKRVPHATEDGLQEGRPHPALRRYQADYGVVDWTEGIKLLGQRRRGDVPPIKGGVDDGSKEMVLEGAVLPDPYSKMHIDPKAPIRTKEARAGAAAPSAARGPVSRETAMSFLPGEAEAMVPRSYDPFTPASDAHEQDIPPDAVMPPRPPRKADPESRMRAPGSGVPRTGDRAAESYESEIASLRRKVEALSARVAAIDAYLSGRTMVDLGLAGMSVSVPAVDVIESDMGVVLLLPYGGDSMTFVPSVGAEASVRCRDRGVSARAVYTGTRFELPAFGIVGLAFMKDPSSAGPSDAGRKEGISGLVSMLSGS